MAMAPAAGARRSRFVLLACMVVLLAFVVREQFVLFGVVDYPIRGDIRQYFAYAWNLVHHGVFSHVAPGAAVPLPDDFRSPGYPWLLALPLWLFPQDPNSATLGAWYPFALQMQVFLGTATVLLTIVLARDWLSDTWALLAGILLALWPHHIAATGALLSEVAFAFSLAASLFCFSRAWRSHGRRWWVATGATFGYAFLINPVIALFPFLLAAALWLKGRRASMAWMLSAFLVPVLLLAARNATVPPAADAPVGRGPLNFVQGSWPDYHQAHIWFRTGQPVAVAIMQEINREARLLDDSPRRGLAVIGERMADHPRTYVAWYAWEKPWLLWDWNIRLGHGGFYFQDVRHSPLDRGLLNRIFACMRAINPALTFLTLLTAAVLAIRGWKSEHLVPAASVGALALYLTLVHVVFQAEPRYANAYRGLEALLVASALGWFWGLIRDRASPLALADARPTN